MGSKPTIRAIGACRDAQELARLYASAFDGAQERLWSQGEFERLMAAENIHIYGHADGFIVLQSLPDGAEILTLAVAPAAQRQGVARALIAHAQSHLDAARLWLEVAEDNAPARALYAAYGFRQSGRRSKYYKRAGNFAVDALLMELDDKKGEDNG
jgi:ribosomal-protein-alanine N-acetyltransferase